MQRGLSSKGSLFGGAGSIYGPLTDNATVFDDVLMGDDGGDNFGNKEIKNKKTEKLEEKIRILK